MSYVSCFDQVEVSNKFQTVEKLKQYYLFIPLKVKSSEQFILLCYLKLIINLLNSVQGNLPGAHTERAGGQLLHDLLLYLQRHTQAGSHAQEFR